MIIRCPSCKEHKFQDETYGEKRRVMNECKSTSGSKSYRCTICNTVKTPELSDYKK